MKKYSNDKDINRYVRELVRKGWRFKDGKKHPSLFAPCGRRLVVPASPSDSRAFYNFRRDVRFVETKGNRHE